MSGPIVKIDGVAKSFGAVQAVAGVDLEIARGELFALLGGSGCGKTTLLRMLAGFETPDSGRIVIDGQDMTGVPPHLRPVNMMFQSYALFPHLDVANNVGYGLKREGVAKTEIAERVAAALALVKLDGLGARRPAQLSGGQRQRVALARALVKRPKLLLLDEPLAALDRKLREGTRFELVRLQEQLELTFVMVTHDQEEAMGMASRLAVMKDGRIVQTGTPHDVYERPATRFVADFIGVANILQTAPRRWLALRPEKIVLAANRPATAHAATGKIVDIAYEGDRSLYRVAIGNGPVMLVAQMNTERVRESHRRGDAVWLGWSDDAGQPLEE
ncbi:MAG: ABC transporter ATP-binding protein [Reyranella sp.]|uniref:ABC transporter ATP-binding protein n=1 Tax=Reyranella sp. TaxID=1929291 RepID=UPI001AC2CA99|nr:ABC transporter ATP-binding protein [Reyranella sp.]